MELTRIHLFNIITQFRAIFSDEEPVIPSPSNCKVNNILIFYSWLNEKVCKYLILSHSKFTVYTKCANLFTDSRADVDL